ncbi:helix-turn-helix domain-containing protein [Streptomyces sp. Je 1-369]|uniref:helix-turn-helix domain-containing protein n=1 Tax=Streptomyces sp. Je 1-369 TaxID=2966192 RepID=UPI002286B0F1|nr:helix-turn-helix transcriptional regulator [Streptomyces sp. Je 1-369]WAL93739.1 helix-turn-helix transcriptional regulator [Streptomyces sp. Je 1-369]
MIQPNMGERVCPQCGKTWISQGAGRPGTYCGTKCRQAANRESRKSRPEPPDTRLVDEQLLQDFRAIQDEVEELLGSLDYSGAPPEDPLRVLVRIQQRLDAVTIGLVGRARARGASWPDVGGAMNLTPDTVRHKYATAMDRYQRKRAPRTQRPTGPTPRRPAAPDDGPGPGPVRYMITGTFGQHADEEGADVVVCAEELAPALAALHRASGRTLRSVAEQARLSPGYVSRIIAGERLPSWSVVCRLARACGASPAQLRPLWDNALTRRGTKGDTPPSLHAALRYLHRRAGHPDPAQLAAASAQLTTHQITAMLKSAAVLEWETVRELVSALDGEAAYFEPLWRTAVRTRRPPAKRPMPLPPLTHPDRGTAAPVAVFRLLAQFNGVLKSNPLLTEPMREQVRRTIARRARAAAI